MGTTEGHSDRRIALESKAPRRGGNSGSRKEDGPRLNNKNKNLISWLSVFCVSLISGCARVAILVPGASRAQKSRLGNGKCARDRARPTCSAFAIAERDAILNNKS